MTLFEMMIFNYRRNYRLTVTKTSVGYTIHVETKKKILKIQNKIIITRVKPSSRSLYKDKKF